MAQNTQLVPLDSKALNAVTPTTKKKIAAVTKSIESVKSDAQRVAQVSRKELEDVAERYSRAPSTFLAAVVGGVVGTAGGITLSTVAGGLLIVTGPLGLALGAALGVLGFRGRNYWRLERATQKTKGATDLLKAEIAALPRDAPPEVRKELYDQYKSLVTIYSRIARDSIDDGPSESVREINPDS